MILIKKNSQVCWTDQQVESALKADRVLLQFTVKIDENGILTLIEAELIIEQQIALEPSPVLCNIRKRKPIWGPSSEWAMKMQKQELNVRK